MAKNQYGTSPWGAAFLHAICEQTDDGRLSRGKSYANTGKVYDVSLSANTISAKVKGNYKPYYKTKLFFHEFSKGDKRFITEHIEKNPLILAQIIRSKLSSEILQFLQKNEIDLFSGFGMDCSCPDFYGAYPCKHITGLYYILVKEIDKNPFILFSLRGLDLIKHFDIKKNLEIPYPIELEFQDPQEQKTNNENRIEILGLSPQKEFIHSMLESNPPFAPLDYKSVLHEFYTLITKNLPLVIWPTYSEGVQKCERLLQGAKISFITTKDITKAKFQITSTLFEAQENRELFGANASFVGKNKLLLSPHELFSYFISFEQNEGSYEYNYLFYIFRVAYIFLQKSAFIPAVFLEKDRLSIFYKPLICNETVYRQLQNLSQAAPSILSLEGKELSGFSQSNLLLMTILTDTIWRFDFMHKAQKNNPPHISQTFFQGIAQNLSGFEKENLPLAIKNYFALFDLIKSDYNYKIAIDKKDREYKLSLSVQEKKSGKEYSLSKSLQVCDAMQILSLVSYIELFLPQITQLLDTKSIDLPKEKLEDFMLGSSHILSNLGIQIVLPKELQNLLKPKLTLRAKAKNKSLKSFFNLDGVLEYDWQIALGDELISAKEFEELVASGKELVAFRDKFVLLSPEEVKAMFKQINQKKKLGTFEILQAKLNDEAIFDADLEALFKQIFTPKNLQLPSSLQATLRPYQKSGIEWTLHNLQNGFGTILADDMGLGKTLQAIAVILYLKENGLCKQTLVILPTSLLSNWEAEIGKFAPTLSFHIFHGPDRVLKKADVILSTYDIARRDLELFKKQKIDCLIIDEAQKIKNPDTRVAQGIKSLKAKYKIALSGTPVENNLSELWSIFDFAIPKYLKSLDNFSKEYAKDIEIHKDRDKIKKLRAITSAFMLRRLKTDKNIIKDLPEKLVIDEYATMSPKQASLYQAVVEKTMARLEEGGNQGAIFALLIALKQICNHPRNYDKTSPSDKALSGKTELLITLLETILEKNEKVLIFTQYTQMAEILMDVIQKELLSLPLYLSGQMSKKQRDEAVQKFQTDPKHKIFILSLKAGGVGLNLTAANHVIHYDLWFNPAVENQATDRAFRIGQNKNVFVYRFITKNSFEEKIDRMIKAKKELSDLSVHVGENWLKDMDKEELKELFA